MEDPDSKRPLAAHGAILNIAATREATKPEPIQNCFKKAVFSNNWVDVMLEEEEEPVILQSFPGYSSIDDNVALYEIQSNEDLSENGNNTQKEPHVIMMKTNMSQLDAPVVVKFGENILEIIYLKSMQ